MKILFSFLFSVFICFASEAKQRFYAGSTPAHAVLRDFLQISPTDSIDFIRWKLEVGPGVFKLQCRYGLSAPSTPGFSNEKQVTFEGQITQSGNFYELKHTDKKVSLFEMNRNVWHFLDHHNRMLVGNGGYSYALNNLHPVEDNEVNIRPGQAARQDLRVFEGRTPCQDLSALLGLNKSEACNKMKWYILLYSDPLTGKPSHFLMGGIGYVKETMARGEWKIVTEPGGRSIYQLSSDRWTRPLNLLKGDDDILFFVDAAGRLLVGNENFSYTLNKRKEEYLPVKR